MTGLQKLVVPVTPLRNCPPPRCSSPSSNSVRSQHCVDCRLPEGLQAVLSSVAKVLKRKSPGNTPLRRKTFSQQPASEMQKFDRQLNAQEATATSCTAQRVCNRLHPPLPPMQRITCAGCLWWKRSDDQDLESRNRNQAILVTQQLKVNKTSERAPCLKFQKKKLKDLL